ncbi:MAG: DnaJ family molecular chaperone [Phyllobacteriaceae bacterium]|nr:DnaJ family molecular chaperone [Phyllobacteriaceae bacterium]
MTIFARIGDFVATNSSIALAGMVEAIKRVFAGDPETRRQVAFSVAMIALSAKMAKADGVVTISEVQAFEEFFAVPPKERRNVERLYALAQGDVAGYRAYASQLAGLCADGVKACPILEDVLDGLFHIAKADGALHDKELHFLQDIADIFGFDETRFERVLARHAVSGKADPWTVLGVARDTPFAEVRKRYRSLAAEHHPDKMMAHGLPKEFLAIAHDRIAAINAAYAMIEQLARAT